MPLMYSTVACTVATVACSLTASLAGPLEALAAQVPRTVQRQTRTAPMGPGPPCDPGDSQESDGPAGSRRGGGLVPTRSPGRARSNTRARVLRLGAQPQPGAVSQGAHAV